MTLSGSHSKKKIKTTYAFENPFYAVAALNKKLDYTTRFHVYCRFYHSIELQYSIACSSLLSRIKRFSFYLHLYYTTDLCQITAET